MDYKYEFERLLDTVDQFLASPRSKATLQVLKNASQYYKETRLAVLTKKTKVTIPRSCKVCKFKIKCSTHTVNDGFCIDRHNRIL